MTTKKDGIQRLRQVPMFADLSQRDLGRLWDHMKIVEHTAGHRIMAEGRSGQGFHLILDGEVTVQRKRKQVVLGPGSFFGEMSLIDEGPRSASVTANGPVTTATLSAWEFKSVVKAQPELTWKFLVHVTSRLRAEQAANDSLDA
jgi:CRP-like cAMP-binding protein